MAEDTGNEGSTEEEKESEGDDFGALTGSGGDSGLGNLPPLSDFDSADSSSEGNLPPLGALDSDAGLETPARGEPAAEEMGLDTPTSDLDTPTFGASGPDTPELVDTPSFDTPASGFDTPAAGLDTPEPGLDTPEPSDGFGFQDLAADSDFSPETPEIGPGPDSDIDTPMFDSAFGGDSGEVPALGETPAPTQAMETPIFDSGGEVGFDKDAFGASPLPSPGLGGDDMGTPVPDFSPDTGMPPQPPTATPAPVKAQKARGGIGGRLVTVGLVAAVPLALALGLFVGPQIGLINPALSEVDKLNTDIDDLKRLNARMKNVQTGTEGAISQEELDKLIGQFEDYTGRVGELTDQLAALQDQVEESETHLALVMEDINEKNDEFARNQELLEELKNDSAITRARHEGLLAENERLTEMVGTLEQSNARRQMTKDTLLHNLDLLLIQIESGIPLTPERYSRTNRLATARTLRARAAQAAWVDPALLNEYTDFYLSEMDIAASREYFFAKIPMHDRLGSEVMQWAECLMNGNWSVYYRTIDGNHVGSFENVAGANPPDYQFREDLPASVRSEIRDQITTARVEDYEEKIAVLNQKQAVFEDKSNLQEIFDSL